MRWRWGVGAGVIVLALLSLLSRTEKKDQPKLHEIRWEAPKEIVEVFKCDLDGDGNEEVVTALKDGEHWWLRPSFKGWRAIKMFVKWDVSFLPFPPRSLNYHLTNGFLRVGCTLSVEALFGGLRFCGMGGGSGLWLLTTKTRGFCEV